MLGKGNRTRFSITFALRTDKGSNGQGVTTFNKNSSGDSAIKRERIKHQKLRPESVLKSMKIHLLFYMKMPIVFLVLSFILCGCNQAEVLKIEKIEKGTLHNLSNGIETELDSDELINLNILLRIGIIPTKSVKWQGWKYIKVTYDNQKQEIISLSEEGYVNFERDNSDYKIKRGYMKVFREITQDVSSS